MKTILIESVTNGWIVRPADFGVCRPADGNMAVYTDIWALKRDLPKLLEWTEPALPQFVTCNDAPENSGTMVPNE